jgi:hypothetical protein
MKTKASLKDCESRGKSSGAGKKMLKGFAKHGQ